ncbi:molybdate ABC transporter substrate-binding protein [Cellulomonas sp.]|uniref:molybdate ABC transporter substrate-binding protein n=1 Tax=Cellulomonas sp. TaxID=40001 RepID=UPI0028110318|nr:molybdate ABC transporter substrate-binding protein [Cellulomonas sp.]
MNGTTVRVRGALATLAAGCLAAGCAGGGAAVPAGSSSPGPTGTVVVLAAASLTDVLAEVETALEARHPGLDVRTSPAASSTLAAQVVAGAPADVLVTASEATTATVTDALGGEPVVVARNTLEIAVPAGNPGGVTGLDDLADPDLTVALCDPSVPCGAVAAEVLASAGVTAAPDTLEQDVRAVLTKVRLREVDAALVYRTDVLAGGDAVEGVDVPPEHAVATAYPALVLPDAPNPAAARAVVDHLRSPAGVEALRAAGFTTP